MKNNEFVSFCTLKETKLETLLINLGYSKQLIKKELTKKQREFVLFSQKEIQIPINLLNDKKIKPAYYSESLNILFENSSFLVVEKPSNLHSHPLHYDETDNVLSWLVGMGRYDIDRVNNSSYDRGLLFRLDFETSGLLIFAKSDLLYSYFRKNFSTAIIEKKYTAIVRGEFNYNGLIEHWIKNREEKGSKIMAFESEVLNTRLAQMEVSAKYIEAKKISLIEIKLKSGHKHQIRVQLAALGFPIIGDFLYGGEAASRLFLHSSRYELESIDQQHYEFFSELPQEFVTLINK